MGDLPADVADLLTASRLLALTKPGGGTRPIAIGETIYRLAGKAALYSSAEPARNHFLPLQFGVAVMGGGEAIIHGARAFASELPESLIAQVDLANAFNSAAKVLNQFRQRWSVALQRGQSLSYLGK
ncbi:hypothetical protein CLOP_g608 [Closterium sp. NIES-67]|nr:hypothetical protein CLOP_g608 [Closterium sp. NIES-67]